MLDLAKAEEDLRTMPPANWVAVYAGRLLDEVRRSREAPERARQALERIKALREELSAAQQPAAAGAIQAKIDAAIVEAQRRAGVTAAANKRGGKRGK